MKEFHLSLPISAQDINKLGVGDIVYLSGRILTLRDHSHKRIEEYARQGKALPFHLEQAAIFHCGPIITRCGKNKWKAICIGATSSSRFSPLLSSVIGVYGSRIIIGKGNLFKEGVEILAAHRAVFLLAVGGCAALYATQVNRVVNNYWKEFGMADSVWELDVREFGPLSVGVDCRGKKYRINLRKNLNKIFHDLRIDPNIDYTWWPQVLPGTKKVYQYLGQD